MKFGNSQDEAGATAPDQDDTANPGVVNNLPAGDSEDDSDEEQKTFTQAELNAIVAKEKAKAARKAERDLTQRAQQPQAPTADAPKPDQFKTAQEYLDAYSDWKADHKVAERETKKQQTAAVDAFQERADQAREKYPDFDKVVSDDDLTITKAMGQAIVESDIGPEVAYYLGKNPKEASRIARLSRDSQIREIGKIEAVLESKQPEVKKTSTSAPDPISPVKPSGTPPKYTTSDPRSLKGRTPSDWITERNRELAKRKN